MRNSFEDPIRQVHGERFYIQAANGIFVSLRAVNGLLAVKQLPKWVVL